MQQEFDQFSERYGEEMGKAIAFCTDDHDFFTEAKARYLLRVAKKKWGILSNLDVLDLGCGVGLTDRYLLNQFKSLTGCDVSAGAVAKARQLVPGVAYQVYDGREIPAQDDTYDLAFAVNVFHHVPPLQRQDLLQEMRRVVKNNGLVVIFEHNPYNPLTMRVVRSCAFDATAHMIKRSELVEYLKKSGYKRLFSRYILFIPFRGKLFRGIDHRLGWLPLGAQYCVAGVK